MKRGNIFGLSPNQPIEMLYEICCTDQPDTDTKLKQINLVLKVCKK